MSTLPELVRLFTELASDLRRSSASSLDGDQASLVSSLTTSLNLDDDQISPRVRVLDAALALMGFTARQVFSARIECLVRTIVSVLSSSVSCSLIADLELLQVGSSISPGDCDELIGTCTEVLGSLEEHNGSSPIGTELSETLAYAVLKLAVTFSLSHNEKSCFERSTAISKLTHFLPEDLTVGTRGIPPRLLLWYLDPLLLKHDISEILRESIQRPFLCLEEELHDRMAWRSVIICLVTSPTMFMETRALLHKWFLVTGLTPVLDLQIAILSAVLDVLSRPLWWGVSIELGLKYPLSHAYFPIKQHELLAILSGHISCQRFLDLVSYIGTEVAPTMEHSVGTDSLWAMVLQFPAWFYFATSLVFCRKNPQDSHLSKFIYGGVTMESTIDTELQQAATQYISWVLSPINGAHRCLLVNHIQEMSRSWITKYRQRYIYQHKTSYSDTHKKTTLGHSKKLRIPKANNDCGKFHLAEEGIRAWLKEYDAVSAKVEQNANVQSKSLLLGKVPLGIFILSPIYLDEGVCKMLLHYAATGEILEVKEMQKEAEGYFCLNDLTLLAGDDRHMWALYGACAVFRVFDIIEDMAAVLFDNEDTQVDFICQLKSKASRYLLRCVETLLKFQVEGRDTMADLYSRLRKWTRQGREVFEGCQGFDDVINKVAKISSHS